MIWLMENLQSSAWLRVSIYWVLPVIMNLNSLERKKKFLFCLPHLYLIGSVSNYLLWYYCTRCHRKYKDKGIASAIRLLTVWFWWLMQLDIMQDRKMPSKMWKSYLGNLEKSFFQQRMKNITYIWSLSMFKFLHRLGVVVRDHFEQKWELKCIFFEWQ